MDYRRIVNRVVVGAGRLWMADRSILSIAAWPPLPDGGPAIWRITPLMNQVAAVLAIVASLAVGSAAYGQCDPSDTFVEISQESADGLGDFDNNILGCLVSFAATGSAAEFYQYGNNDWNGECLDPVGNRSHLLVANTSDGLTLFIVHDGLTNDPDGGDAEMRFELLNDNDGAVRKVHDDLPGDFDDYTGLPGASVFTSDHWWTEPHTDGVALSDLDGSWSMFVQFTEVDGNDTTPPIRGLNEWFAYSADGTTIHLELQENRRVRLRACCRGDVNGDRIVGVTDFLDLLAAWGTDPGGPPDFDGDGVVGVNDFLELLANWGLCPFAVDCNGNGIPDALDVADGTSSDCNTNGIPDECDIADGTSSDCNTNGILDECDIADGTSQDFCGNGVPDECECLADCLADGEVDYSDFLLMLSQWGNVGSGCDCDCGGVGVTDFLYLLAHWGPCPE